MRGLIAFIMRLWLRLVARQQLYKIVNVREPLPRRLKPRTVYVVREDDMPWYARFRCPCGCGAIVSLSLLPGDNSSWRATEHADGTLTLSPSVWRTTGCGSHFSLRKGQVLWHGPADSWRK